MKPRTSSEEPEDTGLVTRVGPLEIDWPRSIGYFGGIGIAVACELIAPPIAIFIAAIPLLKLFKHPGRPGRCESSPTRWRAPPNRSGRMPRRSSVWLPMFQRTGGRGRPGASAILAGCLISPPACV
jgi:hypothetical protein